MNNLKAVFWDVDGTIADTEICGHRVAFNLAFKDFDTDWYWNESKYLELLKISGGINRIIHYRNEINSALTDTKCVNIQSRKRFHYKKLIHAGKIKVREGVIRLIDEIARSNIEQFIVTTSGKDSLYPFLNTSLHAQLKYFTKIITFEDVSKHKPFPDAYNLAIKLSRYSPSECIAIEDSSIGVKAAKAANLNCLLTLPPWSTSNTNITKIADSCIDTLGDCYNKTNVLYGKQLINLYADLPYLINIIN